MVGRAGRTAPGAGSVAMADPRNAVSPAGKGAIILEAAKIEREAVKDRLPGAVGGGLAGEPITGRGDVARSY